MKLRLKYTLLFLGISVLPSAVLAGFFLSLGQYEDADIVFAVFLLFITAGAALFFAFKVSKPLISLTSDVKRFLDGDMESRVKSGVGDISGIGSMFNTLIERYQISSAKSSSERDEVAFERNKLQSILRVIDNAIIAIDNERRIVLYNLAAEKLLEIPQEEVLRRNVSEVFSLFDGDHELPIHIYCPEVGFEEAAGSSQEAFQEDGFVYNKSGLILRTPGNRTREHTVNITTSQIKSNSNSKAEDVSCIFTIHDITSENKLERLKSDFATVAAHQLRTPLSAIKWSLKMLTDGDAGELNPEQKSYLMKTYESNERMIDLVNDMLNAEKLMSDTTEYNLTPTQLTDLADNLLLEHRPQAQKKGVVLTTRGFDETLPSVKIDQEKIRAVVQNLIENAIKYTPAGGMVTVFMESDGNFLKVSVSDTGIGIPHEEKQHIFTRFYRGSNAIKVESNSSGLGLFISKKIVEDHGGKIWFESSQGRGTTFSFTIPL